MNTWWSNNVRNSAVDTFWWFVRNSFYLACLSWVFAYLLTHYQLDFSSMIDKWLNAIFPGLNAMSLNATDPQLWRIYFFSYMVIVFCLEFIFLFELIGYMKKNRNKSNTSQLKNQIKSIIYGAMTFSILTWFLLLNTKPWVASHISRGYLFLMLFHSNAIGLIIVSWVLVFCMCIGFSAFFVGVFSLFLDRLKSD